MNLNKMSGRRTSVLLASMLAGASLLGAADEATPAAVRQAPASATPVPSRKTMKSPACRQPWPPSRNSSKRFRRRLSSSRNSCKAPSMPKLPIRRPPNSLPAWDRSQSDSCGTRPAPAPFALPTMATPAPQAPVASGGNPCETGPDANAVPPYLRLGSVCITPVGFMDLTAVWRDKNAASGIGSNFGSVPYNNTVNGNLSEFRFSPQNSRIGFRIDGDWKGAHFIGYNEFDFLGTSGSNALTVTNGAFVPRLRLFWVDVRKGQHRIPGRPELEHADSEPQGHLGAAGRHLLLASHGRQLHGWSDVDPSARNARPVPPDDKVTFGVSFENPDSTSAVPAAAPSSYFPSAITAFAGTQLDNAGNDRSNKSVFLQPSRPDIIAKLALDPELGVHFEFAGIERNFKNDNPANVTQHFTKTGGGGCGTQTWKSSGVRLITNNFWSDGGGRYLFGQAPDLIVRGDGTLSLDHSGGTVDGIEATIKNTLLMPTTAPTTSAAIQHMRADGKTLVGYGYTGSANSQNRVINELTFGFNQTMWKNPRYGAINFMGQYEWLQRDPWFVALGSPKATHDNTIYVNVRYTLPGSMPNF